MSARKRRLIITSLLTLLFLIIWTATIGRSLFDINSRDEEGAWKTVEHEQYDFSLLYPAQWHARKYGVEGFKGNKTTKLAVYPSLVGTVFITVHYREASTPTVEDVVNWSQGWEPHQAGSQNTQDNSYERLEFEEIALDGHEVARLRYRVGIVMREEVYIPRRNDMIVIRFQAGIEQFNNHEEEFEIILESFSPLE